MGKPFMSTEWQQLHQLHTRPTCSLNHLLRLFYDSMWRPLPRLLAATAYSCSPVCQPEAHSSSPHLIRQLVAGVPATVGAAAFPSARVRVPAAAVA